VSVPSDDAGWRRLIRSGQAPFWRLLAEKSGAEVIEREGVLAAIFPEAPDRSIFNSVFYEDGEALIGMLDELAGAYEQAGVRAWTVWVPEDDPAIAEALVAAGHHDDAQPRDMGMEISDLHRPEPDDGLEIREEYDLATMARINEAAYGWAEGEFGPMEGAVIPEMRVYLGAIDGETVSSAAIWPNRSDAEVNWVATLPEGRGRGISGRLLAWALDDARDRGLVTTTLVSTKLGYPVYSKLGYRDFGAMHMWERRKAAPSRSEGRSP
jgi:GNAT superfamily N-acetyltransferase